MSDELERHRAVIRECDREITRALHRRAEAARAIGHHKQAAGEPFYDASRQKEVLRQVVEAAAGGAFPADGLRRVFSEIMSVCLGMERPIRVGYLGPAGTHSHQAALAEFGSTPELRAYPNFSDIFDAVDREWIDYGIVPIENSANGMVHYVLDLFLAHGKSLTIVGETVIPVHHCLLSRAPLDAVERVYSHQQGLQQCRTWLRRNLPQAELIEVSSTAAGAQRAAEDAQAAAISSALAAELYELNILAPNIEDMTQNFTRFLTLGRHAAKRSGRDKTSLMFNVPDRPGALFHILQYFSEANINLTKIENRPSRRKAWDVVFFVDLLGHHEEPHIAAVIERLRAECDFFELLGSYPQDIGAGNGGTAEQPAAQDQENDADK